MPAQGDAPVELATIARPQPDASVAAVLPAVQQTVATSDVTVHGPVSQPGPAPSPPTGSPAASVATNHCPTSDKPYSERLRDWLCQTWIVNFAGIIGIVGVIWTLYAGVVGLRIDIWAARNDALQTCLSLHAEHVYSTYCNETIDAGVTGPPLRKRTIFTPSVILGVRLDRDSAFILTMMVVVTIAAGVMTTICFNPRTRPFRPTISLVRLDYLCSGEGWFAIDIHQGKVRMGHLQIFNTQRLDEDESEDEQSDTASQSHPSSGSEDFAPAVVTHEPHLDVDHWGHSTMPEEGQWGDDHTIDTGSEALKGVGPPAQPRVQFAESIAYIDDDGDSTSDELIEDTFDMSSLMYGYDDVEETIDRPSFLLHRSRKDQPLYQMTWEKQRQVLHDCLLVLLNRLAPLKDYELGVQTRGDLSLRALSRNELAHLSFGISNMQNTNIGRPFRLRNLRLGFSRLVLLSLMPAYQLDGADVSTAILNAFTAHLAMALQDTLYEEFRNVYEGDQPHPRGIPNAYCCETFT